MGFCSVGNCQNVSQYRCPRCEAPYCSVQCYKVHSDDCVTAFGSEAATAMRSISVSDEQRRNFEKLLERVEHDNVGLFKDGSTPPPDFRPREDNAAADGECPGGAELLESLMSQLDDTKKETLFTTIHKAMSSELGSQPDPSDSDNDGDDSSTESHDYEQEDSSSSDEEKAARTSTGERTSHYGNGLSTADILQNLVDDMEEMDLSYDDILARLPPALASQFEARLHHGETDDLVRMWQPWWEPHDTRPGSDNVNNAGQARPKLEYADVPQLPAAKELGVDIGAARKLASPALLLNVAEVVFGYCVTMRMCNGDWKSQAAAAARILWEASRSIGNDIRYSSAMDMCQGCVEYTTQRWSREMSFAGLIDTAAVFGGCSSWIAAALYETKQLLAASRLNISNREGRMAHRRAIRKTEFLLAWVLGEESSALVECAREINRFVDRHTGGEEKSNG